MANRTAIPLTASHTWGPTFRLARFDTEQENEGGLAGGINKILICSTCGNGLTMIKGSGIHDNMREKIEGSYAQ